MSLIRFLLGFNQVTVKILHIAYKFFAKIAVHKKKQQQKYYKKQSTTQLYLLPIG